MTPRLSGPGVAQSPISSRPEGVAAAVLRGGLTWRHVCSHMWPTFM